jgi:hypothetical protein
MLRIRFVLVTAIAGLALLSGCAQGMMGGQGYGGRGYGMMGGGYGGYGGPGMMGAYGSAIQPGNPLGIDQAKSAVLAFLSTRSDKNLSVDELIQFTNGYYALIKEKDTGKGAFELLVDEYNGGVYPEPGPNMMWNDKYGPMSLGLANPFSPWISAEDAKTALRTWLDAHGDNAPYDFDLDEFYGYYTIDFSKDGVVVGMASVNAITGAVWYHMWHGNFVAIQK